MNLAIDTFPTERFGLITGSRCSALVPKKSAEVGQRTLAKKLANEMFFKFYDETYNWQTEHGKMAEHFAHQHYELYYDNQIQLGAWHKVGECGGSTDAEADSYGVDYKSPTSLENWLDYLYEGISDYEYNQCQHYMNLTGKKKWIIAAFLTETNFMNDNGLTYPVKEKDRMILVEVERSNEWKEKFDLNLPKVVNLRNEFYEKLKIKFEYGIRS